jgi:hypothetical protein
MLFPLGVYKQNSGVQKQQRPLSFFSSYIRGTLFSFLSSTRSLFCPALSVYMTHPYSLVKYRPSLCPALRALHRPSVTCGARRRRLIRRQRRPRVTPREVPSVTKTNGVLFLDLTCCELAAAICGSKRRNRTGQSLVFHEALHRSRSSVESTSVAETQRERHGRPSVRRVESLRLKRNTRCKLLVTARLKPVE